MAAERPGRPPTDLSIADYDPYLDQVREDPYPWYGMLRDACPVHHHVLDSAQLEKINSNPLIARPTKEFWSVFRREDCITALQDSETFINAQGPAPERLEAPDGVGMLVYADEPHHRRQRRIVSRAFTPRMVDAMIPWIEAEAHRMIDGFVDDGAVDLVPNFASALPINTIATMLGVPGGDHATFRRWTEDVVGGFGGDQESYERSGAAAVELTEYFMAEVRRRRAAAERGEELPEDILTTLMVAPYEERQFNDMELAMASEHLLIAGNDSTTASIGNAVHLLCTHPGERAKLDADPALLDAAVEEVLRFHTPVQGLFRSTSRPTELAGCPIPDDAKVRIMFASANRDPRWMEDPDVFRIDRPTEEIGRHIAFGTGAHACLGAALGRAEVRIALRALLDRLPRLRLDPARPARRVDNFFMWGWSSLPVLWDTR